MCMFLMTCCFDSCTNTYINNFAENTSEKIEKEQAELLNKHSLRIIIWLLKWIWQVVFLGICFRRFCTYFCNWMERSIRQPQYFIELLTFKMICGQFIFSRFLANLTYRKIYCGVDAILQLMSKKKKVRTAHSITSLLTCYLYLREKTIVWPYFILK